MRSAEVARELEAIRKRHRGILRPGDVVEYARDQKTALHELFEWDDGKAAEEYRLEQARQVIRCTVHLIEDEQPPVRAYVSLQDDRKAGNSYRSIEEVLASPKLREALLSQALREANSWQKRYERLNELKPVFRAIQKAEKTITAA